MNRLLLLAALAPALAAAQPMADASALGTSPDEPFVVLRLAGSIDLDGRADEAAWEAIAPLPLVTRWPRRAHQSRG